MEEPVASPAGAAPTLRTRTTAEGIVIATPDIPASLDAAQAAAAQRSMLDGIFSELGQEPSVVWFYTPMALDHAGHFEPALTIFDSMDQLSAFQGASPRLPVLERRLLDRADLVFTGGRSLHEAKRHLNPRTHLFPSSVDVSHFGRARGRDASPPDQARLPRPRIGFFGVVDERMDLALLDGVARLRPDWQIVVVGPVTKIDPASLPRRPNLHWLGPKPYASLPAYLSGWDAGLMPFALNAATRFISPTKTPEYLAAGVPLVSTPIPDVVHDWVSDGLVDVADSPQSAVAALRRALANPREGWLAGVDERLARTSWDRTWSGMHTLIIEAMSEDRPEIAGRADQPGAKLTGDV